MSTKDIRKFAILLIGAIITVFGLLPTRLSAQVLHLQTGTTVVNSSQAACVHFIEPTTDPADGLDSAMQSGCSGGQLTMLLRTGLLSAPHTVSVGAVARLIVQFQVDTQPSAPAVSTLPVLISVPVNWQGTLWNDGIIPPNGPLEPISAYADVNGKLYFGPGQAGNLQTAGIASAENDFMAAAHGGITGCLSVPKTEVQGALMLAKCAIATFKKEGGNATVYVAGMIQTGQTYNVVLQLNANIFTICGGTLCPGREGSPVVNFQNDPVTNQADSSIGLTWSNPMTITIGTDFQSRITGLQKEIGDLQNQLNLLTQEFKTHTHVYLTGKGVGQNNTPAKTSTPMFPPFPLFP